MMDAGSARSDCVVSIMNKNHLDEVRQFLARPSSYTDLEDLLLRLVDLDYVSVRDSLRELADFDFAPDVKWVTRYAAAILQSLYGEQGLKDLAEMVLEDDSLAHIVVNIGVLACAAASVLEVLIDSEILFMPRLRERLKIKAKNQDSDHPELASKKELFRVLATLPSVPWVNVGLNHTLSQLEHLRVSSGCDQIENAIAELYAALTSRWFGLSRSGFSELRMLLAEQSISEERIQLFLESHPHLLEPFFAEIWAKPRLGEFLVADFLVRLMDDSYLVVEIEKPSDMILTRTGNLSAKATHAVRQALEYREWLLSNMLYAKQRFPGIWRPTCLVIVGLESSLDETQIARLRQENESRQGILKIVGFDWLLRRAETIIDNIINRGIRR